MDNRVCLNCYEIEEDEERENCSYCGYFNLVDITTLIDYANAYIREHDEFDEMLEYDN